MHIRPATLKDVTALTELFIEMELHYGADNSHQKPLISKRIEAWIANMSSATFLVAESAEGAVLGHLSAVQLFPSGAGQSAMFVKDVYVRDSARGKGIGKALLKACAVEAKKLGCPRLELTVDKTNPDAARLYETLGAVDTDKRYLRWESDALDGLAEGQDDE